MKPVTKTTWKIFWEHTKPHKGMITLLVLGVFVTSALDVAEPWLLKLVVDALTGEDPLRIDLAKRYLWYLFGVWILAQSIWRVMGYAWNFLQPKVMSDLLNTCYEYMLGHSCGFFNSDFVGGLVSKVKRYQNAYESITDIILWEFSRTIIRFIGIIAFLFWYLPLFAWITLVWFAVYMSFVFLFSRYKMKFDLRLSEQDTKTTAQLADTFTNNLSLKLFNGTESENKRFQEITGTLFRLRRKSWNLGNHANVFQGFSMAILSLVVFRISIDYFQRGELSIGEVVMLQGYVSQITERLWDFSRSIRSIYENLAYANEMSQVLQEPHEVVDKLCARELEVIRGEIEFRNLNFHYEKESSIFRDFNLRVRPGEKIALVGPSGGGKSTSVTLLFRLKDWQSGQLLIDGQDVTEVSQDSLRRAVSLVPQDPIMFHRTLFENIQYGCPGASRDRVIAAAKAAHAHEFISRFPKGYDTLTGERGVILSGGQRQRVAIARAILKNAPILVLDEATSSLDSESEQLIQDALKTLLTGKTTIVIAHRLSTIRMMDRIIVLEGGRVTEEGKHEDLLRRGGTYSRLWNIQAGSFAMAE